MLEDIASKGVIEESDCSWPTPVVLARKREGIFRFCVDYRKLNDVTKRTAFR
jgi:hypothetical protein